MRQHPFIENGQVIGEGYIGRHETIGDIMRILGTNKRDGGVVVSGLTRMGKTSLVKKCFRNAEKEGLLEANRVITAELTISTVLNFSMFLKELADKLHDAMEDQDLLDDKLESLFDKMTAAAGAGEGVVYEQDRIFTRILKRMAKADIKAVVLLDEFDDATRAFQYPGEELSANFQRFRNYASEADYNITFILTSRVKLEIIDKSPEAGSNLRGVFSDKTLVGFTDAERNEYFEKIEKYGVKLNEEQKKDFIHYAGRSPYLFTKLACGILNGDESIPAEEISIEKVFKEKKNDFDAYFDSLVRHMEREKLYSKMLQLFCGPVVDIGPDDIKALGEGGYIYHDEDKDFTDEAYWGDPEGGGSDIYTYQTLSQYFVAYLRGRMKEGDDALKVWRELIEAETKLRKIIEEGLREQFGDKWKDGLKKAARQQKLFDVEQAEKYLRNSRRDYGDAVDDNPLVVVSISDLGKIIQAFWEDQFEKWFDPPYNQPKALRTELKLMHRVRNPLAHGTPEYLRPQEKEKVNEYCRKILKLKT